MSRHARNVLIGAFVVTCLIFAAFPVSIHFKLSAAEHADRTARILAVYPVWPHFDGHLNKDYGLWYRVGLVARSKTAVYPAADDRGPAGNRLSFPFMYPPFAGAVLAWLSHLGQTGMLVVLVLANMAAWLLAVWLSVRLVNGPGPARPLVWGLPSVLCVFFVYEMFLLGQPNLGLLVLLLGGLPPAPGRPPGAGRRAIRGGGGAEGVPGGGAGVPSVAAVLVGGGEHGTGHGRPARAGARAQPRLGPESDRATAVGGRHDP